MLYVQTEKTQENKGIKTVSAGPWQGQDHPPLDVCRLGLATDLPACELLVNMSTVSIV